MDMEIVKVYYIFMQHSPITMRTWNFYIADNSIWVRLNNIPTLKLMIHWSRLTGWIVWYQTLFRIKSWFNWLACLFFLFFFFQGLMADRQRTKREFERNTSVLTLRSINKQQISNLLFTVANVIRSSLQQEMNNKIISKGVLNRNVLASYMIKTKYLRLICKKKKLDDAQYAIHDCLVTRWTVITFPISVYISQLVPVSVLKSKYISDWNQSTSVNERVF